MKKKLVIPLLLFSIMTLLPVMSVQTQKPAPNLTGTMDLQYNLGWPGPQDEIPDWVGNITFDGGHTFYDMAFYCIGSGKSFVTSPDSLKGKIHFFEEIWVIGQINYVFDENGVLAYYEEEAILCWGYDTGTTNTQNSRYHMNGNVEEASGFFEYYTGRSVHMSGVIVWQILGTPENPKIAPFEAPGTFRIN